MRSNSGKLIEKLRVKSTSLFNGSNILSSKVLPSSVEFIAFGKRFVELVRLMQGVKSVAGGMDAKMMLDSAIVAMLQAYENIKMVV